MSWARIRFLAQQVRQMSTFSRDQQIKAEVKSMGERVRLEQDFRRLLVEKKNLIPERYRVSASWLYSDSLKCKDLNELQELANKPEMANIRESLLAKPKK